MAAALGAGAVIGLAVSATASAAPRDDSGSAAGRDSTPRRGTAHSAHDGAVRSPGVRPAAAAATVTDRPVAQRSVTQRPVTVPAAVALDIPPEAPKPAAAVTDAPDPAPPSRAGRNPGRPAAGVAPAPSAAAPTADVPVPPAAATVATVLPARAIPAVAAAPAAAARTSAAPGAPAAASLMSLLGCDPRGRLITIYKGTHFAIPNSFGYFIKQVTGTGTFTSDTVYDLEDEDQYDWNKFTGIAFTPLEPDRNSVMVGWRYNLTTREFEIAPFYNVDKKRILPDEQTEVISVPAGETFDYFVDYQGVTISYGGKTVYKPYPQGLTPNVWTASRVSGWFGGNEVAPRTVSYYLKLQ